MPQRTLVNNRYELELLPLAKGGMGEVFIGHDKDLDREVAVKLIRLSQDIPDQDAIRRFVRESRITARLQHPGIPAVYDIGTHDGWPYLVMQRIKGITVADLIAENGPLSIGWAAAIAAQVCATLVSAHQASLVHRDLKPSNLMLEADGTIKVLDFGLAVAFDMANFSKITMTGQSVGTPAYMAPEQVNAATSTPQTDLYALGCTLHEMLTGQPLFGGSTAYAVMSKQVDQRPQPVRELRSDVPNDLEQLLLDLLEKDPQNRPVSAEVVYRRLVPFVHAAGALPGVLNAWATPSPVRMYAGVLSRVFAEPVAQGSTPTTPALTPLAPATLYTAPPFLHHGQAPVLPGHSNQPLYPQGPPAQAPLEAWNPAAAWYPPPTMAAPPATTPPTTGWRVRQSLWLLLPVLGSGCLGGSGLVYVGLRAKRPVWWISGIAYTLLGWLGFVLGGATDKTSSASNWGVSIWLLSTVGGILHAALINPSWLRWRATPDTRYVLPAIYNDGGSVSPGHEPTHAHTATARTAPLRRTDVRH